MDRLILTIKKILKFYDKLGYKEILKEFSLVANDGALAFLIDDDLSQGQKKKFLENMLVSMEETRREKQEVVEVNDYLYYYSSLQQRLHDAIDYE